MAPVDEGFRLFTRGRLVLRAAYLDHAGTLREDALQKLWASGVSITMTQLEDYSNRVLALIRGLEASLHCPVQVNLYMTPGEAQGLGVHVDDHDVLVLQLQGRKTWDIYDRQVGGGESANPSADTARPVECPETITLEAGGWLYVPKGVRHEVRNKATEPSIHLAIGFHPLTWGRMLQEGVEKALRHDPAFHAPCPADMSVTTDEIGRYLSALRAFMEPPATYYRGFRALETPVPRDGLTDRSRLDTASLTTRFVWRKEAVEIGRDGCELNLSYRRHPLLLRPELGPVVGWMVQQSELCPSDLRTMEQESALLLCKFLTNAGMLRLAE